MAQHDTSHVLATVRLAGTSAGPWPQEIATWSVRLMAGLPDDIPPLDAGRVKMPSFLVNDASVSRTTATWQISQGWAGDSSPGAANFTDAAQDAIADALLGFLVNSQTYLTSFYRLESIRLYPIGQGGRTNTAPSIYEKLLAWQGGAGTLLNPRDAVAVSFRTSTRGPAGRGRAFIGPLGSNVNDASTGRVSAAAISSFSGNMDTCLTAINNLGGATLDARCAVVHRSTLQLPVADHEGSPINYVRVGDQLDTQRRRSNKRRETYVSTPI